MTEEERSLLEKMKLNAEKLKMKINESRDLVAAYSIENEEVKSLIDNTKSEIRKKFNFGVNFVSSTNDKIRSKIPFKGQIFF